MENEDYTEYLSSVFDLNNLSILTGTGLAKACGGKSMVEVAKDLIEYLNVLEGDEDVNLWKESCLGVEAPNFEKFLNFLITKKKYLDSIGSENTFLEGVINKSKEIVYEACDYTPDETASRDLLKFFSTISMRKAGLARPNLFTLNYDLLQETAADNLGIVLNDGFNGSATQSFNPANFDKDYYYPSGVIGQQPVRCENVINYFKLHGSINWKSNEDEIIKSKPSAENMIIYPSYDKLNDTLLDPFNELLKRFNDSLKKPKSSLILIGYGFGDSHVNRILLQALQSPSFTLINVNPNANLIYEQIPKSKQFEFKITNIHKTFDDFINNFISTPNLVSDTNEEIINSFIKRLNDHVLSSH